MTKLNILETGTGRQALNVLPQALVETVTPWFADVAGDKRVRQALASLSKEGHNHKAMEYLGLHIEEIATNLAV